MLLLQMSEFELWTNTQINWAESKYYHEMEIEILGLLKCNTARLIQRSAAVCDTDNSELMD